MRTPVNDPGPAPNAIASRSASVQPASAQHRVDQRQQALRVRLAREFRRARPTASPSPQATESQCVEVSKARSFMAAILPDRQAATAPARTTVPLSRSRRREAPSPRMAHTVAIARRDRRSRSNRSTRKAAASRTSTARRCSSRARCPGERVDRRRCSRTSRAYDDRARRDDPASASAVARRRRAVRTSASAAAARCSTRIPSLQVAAKQRALEDALRAHRPRARRDVMLPPIDGPAWGYRVSRAPVGAPRRRRRAACWSASTSASRASSRT